MQFSSLSAFASTAAGAVRTKGPIALVLLEDAVEAHSTVAHCQSAGFREVFVFGTADLLDGALADADETVHTIVHDMHGPDALAAAVNSAIRAYPEIWMHYCYNTEYLFFPFCETRNIRELIAFNIEERRDTIMTFVIDLYSNDLGRNPDAVSLEDAHLDRSGYYALARHDAEGPPLDRQLDFFGGLRWRFEEHVPWTRRKIDRVSLFRSFKGLELRPDHTFNEPEYNTYTCPWHHSLTANICSFRTAKALMSNPGSMYAIPHFWWTNSTRFEWNSNQLMELGLMEPGQWF
ncbi:MAG: hypothetical protein HKP40_01965 [Litoreibacter sp.]|nr:hypothetical protein [Litoreibacter sp.]